MVSFQNRYIHPPSTKLPSSSMAYACGDELLSKDKRADGSFADSAERPARFASRSRRKKLFCKKLFCMHKETVQAYLGRFVRSLSPLASFRMISQRGVEPHFNSRWDLWLYLMSHFHLKFHFMSLHLRHICLPPTHLPACMVSVVVCAVIWRTRLSLFLSKSFCRHLPPRC